MGEGGKRKGRRGGRGGGMGRNSEKGPKKMGN